MLWNIGSSIDITVIQKTTSNHNHKQVHTIATFEYSTITTTTSNSKLPTTNIQYI